MGAYSEYLNRGMSFQDLSGERKNQLSLISKARGGRDILVYAADLNSRKAPISIDYTDLLPIKDQLANLKGNAVDLILETPGGSGEVAEDIVELLREQFKNVAVIVPGWAKSAGTLIAMAADEILMDQSSALGPIDAQLFWQGKVFSADALIEGMEKIKEEVENTGKLNKAYIPILQGISPGELQSAQNALDFAKDLVAEWLANYKFQNWDTHKSTGEKVTHQERCERAEEIATKLCDHQNWKTHGRSIKLEDLEEIRLQITDYSRDQALSEAIHRYHTLLQMTFASNAYKLIETKASQIYRFAADANAIHPLQSDAVLLEVKCDKCGKKMKVQANFEKALPLQKGSIAFPSNNRLKCSDCGVMIDLNDIRRRIEAETKKSIII